MLRSTAAIALFGALLVTGCTEGAPSGPDPDVLKRGQLIYAKECSACHGAQGTGSGSTANELGLAPPDLTGLARRNDGYFPREFVRRFLMGQVEREDPDSPMPDFSEAGLQHVYPEGGADGEVLETDFVDLIDYIEAIQN